MQPVFKQGTTKDQIIFDGWSRGFSISQVMKEVDAQGFNVDAGEVQASFNAHQAEMEEYYMSND